jgi:hypothetical protein
MNKVIRHNQNTELKVKPEDFCAYLNIKHWSGCWGGIIIQEPISNPASYLEKLANEAEWLSEFLRNTSYNQLTADQLTGTENGRKKELTGQEYILKVRLQNSNGDLNNSAIVACVNGQPLSGIPEYRHLAVGRGLFQGYKLRPGRFRYTVALPYIITERGYYDHTSFSSSSKTIIGVHLFMTDNELSRDSVLSNTKPTATKILVFDPNWNGEHKA